MASGFDVADNEIVKMLSPGDLVITSDIPLAAEVIEKGGHALNPRGELYSEETIRERLNMRDFMDTLRSSGIETGGPPPLSPKNRNAFANHLDKLLTAGSHKKRAFKLALGAAGDIDPIGGHALLQGVVKSNLPSFGTDENSGEALKKAIFRCIV